jgi:O-antigen/teichoic acid export membrane protein
MNSTQKLAWIFLLSVLLNTAGAAYVGSVLVFRTMPPRPFGQMAVAAVALASLAFCALTAFFLTKRQSRAEPESDERDSIIRGKAATIGLVGSWLLLAVILLVLGLTFGQTGAVPVYVLTIILWGAALVTLLIYAVAILAQYGRAHKGDET